MTHLANRSTGGSSAATAGNGASPAISVRMCLAMIFCLLISFVCSGPAQGVSASPHAILETQPDGSKIILHIRGNEHFHWQEDADGFTVLRDNKRYVYARRNAQGRLMPTAWEVGKVNPRAKWLMKRILPPPPAFSPHRVTAPEGTARQRALASAQTISGTVKNLVVMVRFADHQSRPLPSASDMNVLFNALAKDATLAPTGSVKMVYLENSYNKLSLNSTISGWITVSGNEAYYADGQSGSSRLWEALREALTILDARLNFADFDSDNDGYIDSITFIHSGYAAEWGGSDAFGAFYGDRIWSHFWSIQPAWSSRDKNALNTFVKVFDYHISPGLWGRSGSAIGRIGAIAHETGHFFGLPDLYDTDGDGKGIGSYGLMANSWGFDGSQLYPPHLSPWSKIRLGWLTPTEISQAGTFALPAVQHTPTVFKITSGFPDGEYLLIENRQPLGFDGDMPQGGLLVWHIDEQADYDTQGFPGQPGWPENGRHYRVALLQADSKYELEKYIDRGDSGDVYHGAGVDEIGPATLPSTDAYQGGAVYPTGNQLFFISPSAATMTFSYRSDGTGPKPPAAPTGLKLRELSSGP